MLRKFICLFGAACMVLWVGVPARAAEGDTAVRVVPAWGGQPVAGGTVMLSRVGSAAAEGYQLTDGLANWSVKEEELQDRALLKWLEENVREGICREAGEEGAEFSGLEEGLYLVTQPDVPEGYSGFVPYLLEVRAGESVMTRPGLIRQGESPRTGDRPAPIIGAMGIGLSAAVLMVLMDEKKR